MKIFKKSKGLTLILLAALLLEVISGIQYYYTHGMLAEELEKRAELELMTKVILTKSNMTLAVNSLNGHLWDVMDNINQPDSMYDVVECVLRSHKNLLGCGIAFEPNFYPTKGRLYEPYAYWHDGDVVKAQIASDHHDYTQNASYQKAVRTRECLWTEPYYYEEAKTSMVTYVQPLKDANDSIMAVFMLDLSTDWWGDTLNYRKLYPSSYTLLLSEQGKLIAGPRMTEKNEEDIRHIIAVVNDDDTGKLLCSKENTRTYSFKSSSGDEAFVFTAKFMTPPHWQMVVVCYEDEVFGPLRDVRINILLMMLVGFAIMGFIVYRFFMKERDLNKTLLKQTRIDSELRIARDIQLKMIPMTYPPFPDRSDLDIYGSLVPAREVGGDIFDFFIRDEKLFFCIGDVSGKGVPAAMLMAVTHSLFRSSSTHENNPSRIMHLINETACQGNDTNMFVTMFIGVLNLPTGRLRYCNAGHDRPIVISHNGIIMLDAKPNLPVGVFDDMRYETEECVLSPDCMMFLYTDGLTEAMAPLPTTDLNTETVRHNLFGIERVMNHLRHHEAQISAKQLLDSINMAVNNFVGDAEQSDDLTMLAIRYAPESDESILIDGITLRNNIKDVPHLNDYVKNVIRQLAIDETTGKKLRLAIEEAVVNVMNYAYAPGVAGNIEVKAMYNRHFVKFVIIDSGRPFDPTEAVRADTTLSAEDRPIGGLGIFILREIMDTVNYERVDGSNILTLRKNIETHYSSVKA